MPTCIDTLEALQATGNNVGRLGKLFVCVSGTTHLDPAKGDVTPRLHPTDQALRKYRSPLRVVGGRRANRKGAALIL